MRTTLAMVLTGAVLLASCVNDRPPSNALGIGSASPPATVSASSSAIDSMSRVAAGSPSPAITGPRLDTASSPEALPTATPSASRAIGRGAPAGGLLFFRSGGEGSKNGSAWLVPAVGGRTRRLGPAIEASWSVDGTVIHMVRQNQTCVPRLITVTPTGRVLAIVDHGLRPQDSGFAWSPNGRRVVFFRYHYGPPSGSCGSQGGVYPDKVTTQDIIVMNADGSGQRILVAKVWFLRPGSWSPDGSRIAFARGISPLEQNLWDLVVVRVRDGAIRRLRRPSGLSLSAPRWSPDSARLAFTFNRDLAWHAAVVGIGGRRVVDLGAPGRDDRDPSWAPDSSRIATSHSIEVGGTIVGGDISVCRVEGSRCRNLGVTDVESGLGPPAWSPDGRWLAYLTAGDENGAAGIVVIRADGTRLKALADTAGAQSVSWQP